MRRSQSKISVSENNRRFEVVVNRGCGADWVHIDDPAYAHLARRCDYAIRVSPGNPRHFFFVELKGNDVIKAAEQLEYTVANLKAMYSAYASRQAWVIAGGFRPAVQTRWQVLQRKMKACGFKMFHQTKSWSVDLTK